MDTDAPMATATDILTLAQWFSPAYPVGGYAYSHGLEWAIDSGAVQDAQSARAWILDAVQFGAGRADAIALHLGHAASTPADLDRLDADIRARAPSAERLQETDQQGRAFAEITRALWPSELPALCYPVAVGQAARLAGLPVVLTAQFFVQAFMSNLAAAAMRRVPIGQTDGQRIIRDLTPACARLGESTATASLDDIAGSAFVVDIAAMNHETQYSRIFRT